MGQFVARAQLQKGNKTQNCHFRIIVAKSSQDLLSRTVAAHLGLIKYVRDVSVFGGLGLLQYFNPKLPRVLSADESSYGLGRVLLQKGHSSRKERVGISGFTITCVGTYRRVMDHKPLVTLINNKDLDRTPLRCQWLLIRLS